MKYELVFSKAWNIIWKNKALWLFGLLASCGRSVSSGSGSSGGQSSSSLFHPGVTASPSLQWPAAVSQWLLQLKHSWEAEPWLVLLMILSIFSLIFILVVASFFLGALGRVGVARGAYLADRENLEKLSIGRIFSESLPYFWRVILLTIVIWIALMLLVSMLVLPIMFLAAISAGLLLLFLIPVLLPFSLLMFVLTVAVFVLTEQAIVAIVVEDLGTFEAIQRAWNVFRSHPLPNLIVGAVLMLGQGLVTALILLPFLLTFLPFLFSLFFQTKVAFGFGAAFSGQAFLIYLPVTMILSGMLHAYIGSVWVLTFRQVTTSPSIETVD